MSTTPADPLLETLVSDFGGNYVFALDLLEQYRQDRDSVDAGWRTYFDVATGAAPVKETAAAAAARTEAPAVTVIPAETQTAEPGAPAAGQGLQTLARTEPQASAGGRSTAVARVSVLPGDILQPIRGGAVRIVENMEASLQIPTATSVRTIPVRTLEENRRLLNKHRESTGQTKVSFTHIVAWAILRAFDAFPRMNDAYAEVDGQPHRIQRDKVRLGIAVDVQKKDGSRTLLVPNIKDAGKLDFAAFLKAFDDLVARSRKGTISPDDFMGTTVSLTNPGTVGTTSSAPRLMPGQGVIVATGALDYPAEYRSMAPRTLGLLGISKVMTVTSTYDHRIVQGAESGLFLARMEDLLKGEDGFFDRIFSDLGVPFRPVKWEIDANPAFFGSPGGREEIDKQTKVLQLIHNYRVRGHLVADLDPLDSARAPHRDLDPATYGLTLWDLDREFMTGGLSGEDRATLRDILDVLRETYCGTIGVEYMYIADPERKDWLQRRMEVARNYPALDAASKRRVLEKLVEAESFERFLHAKYVGHKRFSLEGGEALIPLLDRILNDAARARAARGRARHGAPRPAQRPREHDREAAVADLRGVRGQRPELVPGLGRREVPPRRERDAPGRHRRDDRGEPRPEPEPPRVREPGRRGHGAGEAGRDRRPRARARPARAPPRRRGVRRPGRRRRDDEPLRPPRLPHRRHDPRGREQPDRLHDAARGRALVDATRPTSRRWSTPPCST